MVEALSAYRKWFESSDIIAKAVQMYTEIPFSFLEKENIWLHGEADLVLKLNDGRYYIIDYKSDDDDRYESEDAFVERLKRKYGSQIAAYKRAISTVFGVNEDMIDAALISFSRKDVPDGEKLRVRVTEV